MKRAKLAVTVRHAGLKIDVCEYADGRFGFDAEDDGGERLRIRRHSAEDAVEEAKRRMGAGAGGKLDLANVDPAEFEEFLRWRASRKPRALVKDLVEKLLAARERKGVTQATLNELRYTLNPFAEEFGAVPIAALKSDAVEKWLASEPRGPRRWNNMLTVISGLHRFARARGLLGAMLTEVEQIERRRVLPKIDTYTPEEMKRLLAATPDEWVPYVAIGGFCGLRPEEICSDPRGADRKPALRWENILWAKKKIDVLAAVSKVRRRRFAALTDAAIAFLEPLRQKSGPVAPEMVSRHFMRRIAEVAEVTLKPNALRHSYASYRLALTKDAPALAIEMGNSPSMIFKHYAEAKHEEEAEEWFGLRPGRAGNVVEMSAA